MDKVLFLDIDGVMKPGRSYWAESLANDRDGGFDPLAVAAVNRICSKTGACIVFNTTWNLQGPDRMRTIAEQQGIEADIHPDSVTPYPHTSDRLQAIRDWINEHPGITAWAALDDVHLEHDSAITVDGDNGITVENYRRATVLLGAEDKFMVLL